MSLITSSTWPTPDIAVTVVCSTSCAWCCTTDTPIGGTARRCLGDIEHQWNSAQPWAYAIFGALDDIVIALPGIYLACGTDVAVSSTTVPIACWELLGMSLVSAFPQLVMTSFNFSLRKQHLNKENSFFSLHNSSIQHNLGSWVLALSQSKYLAISYTPTIDSQNLIVCWFFNSWRFPLSVLGSSNTACAIPLSHSHVFTIRSSIFFTPRLLYIYI